MLGISMCYRIGPNKSCYLLKSSVPRQTGKSYKPYAKTEISQVWILQHAETSSQQLSVNSIFQKPICQTLACTAADKCTEEFCRLRSGVRHLELSICQPRGWLLAPPPPSTAPHTSMYLLTFGFFSCLQVHIFLYLLSWNYKEDPHCLSG